MKRLLTSTALALALAGPLAAETAMSAQDHTTFAATSAQGSVLASNLIGARLYTSDDGIDPSATGRSDKWHDVGEIHDVVLGKDGTVDTVIADIGGFLGIGEKQVAVGMDQLHFVSDGPDKSDWFVVIRASQADLENAPTYQAAAAAPVTAPAEDKTDLSKMAQQAGQDAKAMATTAGDKMAEAADKTGAAMDKAGQEVAAAADSAGEKIAAAAESVEKKADAAGDKMAQAADTAGTAVKEAVTPAPKSEDMAATDQPMQKGMQAEVEATGSEDGTHTQVGAESVAAASERPPASEIVVEGYETAMITDLTAEQVTGSKVYDLNGDKIGEVNSLILSADGSKVTEAVIDVGGFLGIGEKPVAVDIGELTLKRETDGDDLRVYIDSTKDKLEQLPKYEKG